MAEIGLEGVTVTFGGAPLLEGIALQVERGERVGLLGRNGSGKSRRAINDWPTARKRWPGAE